MTIGKSRFLFVPDENPGLSTSVHKVTVNLMLRTVRIEMFENASFEVVNWCLMKMKCRGGASLFILDSDEKKLMHYDFESALAFRHKLEFSSDAAEAENGLIHAITLRYKAVKIGKCE